MNTITLIEALTFKMEGVNYANKMNIDFKVDMEIDNPNARKIKYKDERKLTIGLSKKDILTSNIKITNAFYNCFALILRFWCSKDLHYREIHVKVFNTGKLEIPGILNTHILESVKE